MVYAPDRWWFWALLSSSAVFALGYAAASGVALFVGTLPFAAALLIYGGLETARLVRVERDDAIREASKIAERVRRMGPIT